MHVAAMRPQVVYREQLDAELVASVKAHHVAEVGGNKPAAVTEKIVDGKMRTWFEERVLMDQKFVKDDSKTVRQLIDECAAATGENVQVARFARFEVGETASP